jgi:hypothetical protein
MMRTISEESPKDSNSSHGDKTYAEKWVGTFLK